MYRYLLDYLPPGLTEKEHGDSGYLIKEGKCQGVRMNINSLTVNHRSPTILDFCILGLIGDPLGWSSSKFSAVTYPPTVYYYDASPSK